MNLEKEIIKFIGQYYRALVVDHNENPYVFESYDYGDNGAKLMEHSYYGNEFVNAVLAKILYNPCKVAWIGDYAASSSYNSMNPANFANYFYKCYSTDTVPVISPEAVQLTNENNNLYLINHTKQIYIDLAEFFDDCHWSEQWGRESVILYFNPLPILTACGNGLGGGDYDGSNMADVGSWAFDFISISDDKPSTDFNRAKYTFNRN